MILPGEEHVATIAVLTREAGRQQLEVAAMLDGQPHASAEAVIEVIQASLSVKLIAAPRWRSQQQAACQIEVANPGTATAHGVRLRYQLAEGHKYLDADKGGYYDPATHQAEWVLGTLEPDQRLLLNIQLMAETPGDYRHQAIAVGEPNLYAEASASLSNELDERAPANLLERVLAEVEQEHTNGTAAGAPARPFSRTAKLGDQHIVFSLAGGDYAVTMDQVLEIGRPLAVSSVPNLPEWVLGVANVRGDIVSMVDLRMLLGLARLDQASADSRMLVVRSRAADLTTGLIVDRVRGICALQADGIRSHDTLVEDKITPFLSGVSDLEGQVVGVLDLERVLRSSEMQQFESV